MTHAIQRQQGGISFSLVPRNFQEAMEFGKIMASSDLVPKDYRGKPGNVLVAVQMGADVGLSPMQAVQNIAVINGRPALWGDAMIAIVQAHPACRGVYETYNAETMTATCEVQRSGRPMVSRTFSVEDAKRANLWKKPGPWTQYPQRMLQMRARGFALRDAFPDALRGLASAEEVEDYAVHAKTGGRTERPTQYVDADVVDTGKEDARPSVNTLNEAMDYIVNMIDEYKTSSEERQNSMYESVVEESAFAMTPYIREGYDMAIVVDAAKKRGLDGLGLAIKRCIQERLLEDGHKVAVAYEEVIASIEASETPEDLTNAARLARELSGEERTKAIELGVNKRAEIEALASARQAAESAEQAARVMEADSNNDAR